MNKKNTKIKFMAIFAVLAMLAVCIVPFNDSENGLDAAVGDGGSYSYTITYDSSAMTTSTATMSVANMEAISHTAGTVTLSSMDEGSWTWNASTGYGPFNSFYAAFDMTDGNSFYAILNPYDLTKTISGAALTPLTNYNIMWVLPTVYVVMGANGDSLTLTNDSSAGGHAYAHTIDGHTYKYVAYGVYEGSTTSVDGQTVLTSTSGTTPTASQTRATFRTYAHNYSMSSTLADDPTHPAYALQWNFDQWKLYQDIAFMLMENTNSQNIVGNGHVYTSNSQYAYTTGALDAMGPYAGNPAQITDNSTAATYGSDSVKLFIENAWGGVRDFVDGIIINGRSGAYIDSSSNPNDGTSGTYITNVSWTIADGFPTSIQTGSDRVWGFPGTTVGGSATTGLADYIYTSSSSNRVLNVGGYAFSDWSNSVQFGLSYAAANSGTSYSSAYFGSRLAFVFDAGPASPATAELTFNVDGTGYGTLGDGTQTGQATITTSVLEGSTLTVSNNTLTAGTTIITATPTTSDDHWTYSFDGWYQGTSKILTSIQVSEDTTINAKFVRTLTNHDATIESNNTAYGTVSTGSITGIPYGETFTVNSNSFSIYTYTVTATPNPSDVEFVYSFDEFQTEGIKLETGMAMTSNMTIRAIFYSTQITHTVSLQSNNDDWGTINNMTLTAVPGGTYFSISGDTLTLDGNTFTPSVRSADAQYTYAFEGWYDALTGGNEITSSTRVLDDMSVYARFSATTNTYTVTIQDDGSGYGSASPATVLNVPYGTVITATNNTLDVNGTTVTATPETNTPQYAYSFRNWTIGQDVITSYTLTGNTTITANFDRSESVYTINFQSNNGEYGSVAPTFIGAVPYGTVITATGNALSVNGATVTATPVSDAQYTGEFINWTVGQTAFTEYTVTGNITITANFDAEINTYTVTWVIGTVTETQTYEYGQTPSHEIPEAPAGQEFKRWSPSISTVTGDITYTAVFGAPQDTDHDLLNMIPLLIVIAIVIAAVSGLAMSGGDPMAIIKLAIGLTVCIIVLAALVIPVVGGL